jgi:hypothetical protein
MWKDESENVENIMVEKNGGTNKEASFGEGI